jgi:RNA polymerase sigma-70 factor (ECF subfamily)
MPGGSGDLREVGNWFREWQSPLRKFLSRRRVGCAADIDDIAQEVFLRLLRYARAEFVEHPQAYLFQAASNVSAEWLTRCRSRLPHESKWLEDLADSLSPESELERESINERLRIAIQTLPPRAREILRLHFAEEMTHPEIASTMGLTRKIVKRDTARAYAALRSTLGRELVGTF